MAEEKVTLLIEAEDAASNVIKGIGGTVVALNQGLEIAKKGLELFNKVVVENFKAMVEYRGENDRVAKRLRELGNEGLWLKAQVFDVLTPIVLGLGEAFNEAGSGVQDYINTNRQLIATNITTYLADLARVLVNGVAEGLLWTSRAVSGLIEGWNLLSALTETWFAVTLAGAKHVYSAMSTVAEFLGADGVAGAFEEASEFAKELGETFEDSADKSMQAVDRQIKKQEEFEESLLNFKTVAVDFVGKAEVAVLKEIEKGWDKVKKKPSEMAEASKAALDQRLADIDAFSEARIAKIEEQAALEESILIAQVERQDQAEALQVQSATVIAGAISSIGVAWTGVALAAMQSSEDIAQAVVSALIDSVIVAINAMAAMAAARAFAANQDFPIVGVAIGLAAASAASAIAKGYLSDVPKAAEGGQVFGGIPGQDSVGTLVQHGEGVLKTGQTAVLQRLADRLESFGGGSGGGSTTILNVTENTTTPTNSADYKRKIRDVKRSMGIR